MDQGKLKQVLGKKLKENEPLSKHTWFKIGGPARFFVAPKSSVELVEALTAAEDSGVPYFILGSGSNILVSDNGFDGLVIQPENRSFSISGTTVTAQAGALVVEVLKATLDAGLTGWPWAAGLPGTIGGALRGNAGAYGKAMGDIVSKADVFYLGKVTTMAREALKFSYRHSILKEIPAVAINVELQLAYGDSRADQQLVAQYNQRRQDTQPLELPSAGCVFKNIDLSEVEIDKKKVIKGLDVTEAEFAEATKYGKLPVSYIVDRLGLKGKTIGGAQVSEKHGAFIVNVGEARAEHVVMLISDVKMRVRNQLGIQLQEEVQYVGF